MRKLKKITLHFYKFQVLEQTNNAKKIAETKLGELAPKYAELTGLNNTLGAAKTKLEKDFVAVKTEYTDIARELKLADERANKASHDAQHFEGMHFVCLFVSLCGPQ